MKNKKILNVMLGLTVMVSLVLGTPAMAWGPDRPTYTMEAPADHATFNSITNNAALGDERDFVRIVEVDSGNSFTSELELEADKEYAVYIYYHNDASETYNDAVHGYAGVARDVRVISYFPDSIKAGERKQIDGIVTASNADPKTVWDEAYITAKEDLTIEYVEGTARIYNQWKTNEKLLSDSLFTEDGVFIGLDELNGVILGCDKYAGQVIYRLKTVAVTEPTTPMVPVETPDPELPKELPTTGPIEIALAVVVVIALVAGVIYWRKSSKAVKKVTKSVHGRKNKK